MIPVRDVIPSRTAPGVTVALLAALLASLAWPAVRAWWLPWAAHVTALWLFGSTVEDRLGHRRYAACCAACVAVATGVPFAMGRGASIQWAVSGGLAGVSAAYFLMFPRARVLALVPVVAGLEFTDVPAWFVCGLWLVIQVAAGWAQVDWSRASDPLAAAVSLVAGGITGALAWLVLRRPERMRVEWWDSPRP